MIKVTAGILFTTQPALAELGVKDLPVGTSLLLNRIISAFEKDIKEFDKKRMELAQKFGSPVENGFRINDEHQVEFDTAIKELSEVEYTYSDFSPIKVASLGDKIDVKPLVLRQLLGWLLEE